ncbi:nucleotidyltransferase family protein [Roseibium hamelinense]|nr:nucleotidyltransferase family protein [Roseibium hamelinense]
MNILKILRELDLPDAWLVSGAIYQTVWNRLTARSPMNGIKDFDVIYFDSCDLSYEAEDRVIQRVRAALPDLADRLEIKNQARVHFWFEQRFGHPYPQLETSLQSLENYASKTHAVAVRLTKMGTLDIQAPFGLQDIFALRLTPNTRLANEKTYREKAARMTRVWPELTVIPWPETASKQVAAKPLPVQN